MRKKKTLGQFSKNYKTFYPKNVTKLDLGCGIWKKPIPEPGSRGQRHRIPDPGSTTLINLLSREKKVWGGAWPFGYKKIRGNIGEECQKEKI
jgi:hypothetical protein